MDSISKNKLVQGLYFAKKRACPECSEQMEQVQRQDEKHSLFIWYECPLEHCSGQWLDRIPVGKETGF